MGGMKGKMVEMQLDSKLEEGVKGMGLDLERKSLARRAMDFLAIRSGGEWRLEKMALFRESQIFQQMYLGKALNKSPKRVFLLKEP